jgi:hypothetical protein
VVLLGLLGRGLGCPAPRSRGAATRRVPVAAIVGDLTLVSADARVLESVAAQSALEAVDDEGLPGETAVDVAYLQTNDEPGGDVLRASEQTVSVVQHPLDAVEVTGPIVVGQGERALEVDIGRQRTVHGVDVEVPIPGIVVAGLHSPFSFPPTTALSLFTV